MAPDQWGEVDNVVVADIHGYDTVYRKLIRAVELFDVSSSFAMERLKYSTALPVMPPHDASPADGPPHQLRR